MKKYLAIISFISLTVALSPCILAADDTNINVNIDSKGVAKGATDETIKLKEYDLKTKEHLEDKEKAEKIKQSDQYCQTADMYYSKGELGMAADYYQKALDANDNNIRAHESLLRVQRELNDIEAGNGEHYHKAMEYLRMGLKQKAIDELVTELKLNPNNEAARVQLNAIEAK